MLKEGDKAPAFKLPSVDGGDLSLKDFAGKTVVLYFYPKDDTPGCTAQACSLRDASAELIAKGAGVLGVSTQGVVSHQKFSWKLKLNFPLLADTDGSVGRAYGVLGGDGIVNKLKTAAGLADRVTFIIDEDGIVKHIIDKPDVDHHAEEVLALL
jgi:peroxiredoxin Q/BCP